MSIESLGSYTTLEMTDPLLPQVSDTTDENLALVPSHDFQPASVKTH